jgi:hypothetical protein
MLEEDRTDLRNSKVSDIIEGLTSFGSIISLLNPGRDNECAQ